MMNEAQPVPEVGTSSFESVTSRFLHAFSCGTRMTPVVAVINTSPDTVEMLSYWLETAELIHDDQRKNR